MCQLTSIEYNVIMEAINNAKASLADGDFIDPYAENPDGYTEESLLAALNSVEAKLIEANIPF